MEASVSEAVTRFEKEHMGRGPLETKTYIVGDMVIVRLQGVLSKAEHRLIKAESNGRGRDLVKQMKTELIENNRGELESVIKAIVKRRIRSLHTDISTETGERIIMLILDKAPHYETPPHFDTPWGPQPATGDTESAGH